ncbi:MAG TPA: hypothetical protein DCS93_05265 [Microscillaceae bacterium]|nr:hypothetical protein [Microscillaceae bacterium]
MKYFTYLFLLIGLGSCSNLVWGTYYNKLEWYSISLEKTAAIEKKEVGLSAKEKKFAQVLMANQPKSLRKADFIKALEGFGFVKQQVPSKKFAGINELLFSEKSEGRRTTSCEPFYRDILVFRRDARLVGIAKICFECNKSYMVGIEHQTRNFGKKNDYEDLEKILKAKP